MYKPSILYGVQGTGNGHISRARLMAAEFSHLGINVEYLFSGRAQNSYFDMQDFAHRRYSTGLSFVASQGRIRKLRTLTNSHPIRYAREVSSLRTDHHDSKHGFRHHLQRCNRVICHTGFELIAEALHLGIPVLTRPLSGQFEQQANAMALKELNLATVTRNLGVLNLDLFIHSAFPRRRIVYPNVARELATFCMSRISGELAAEQIDAALGDMADRLWAQVRQLSGEAAQPDNPDLPTRLVAA